PKLLQPIEVDLDRIVDDDHRRGGAHAVEDGREGGNPRALGVGVDVGVAGDAVLESPAKRVEHLRRHPINDAGTSRPDAHPAPAATSKFASVKMGVVRSTSFWMVTSSRLMRR